MTIEMQTENKCKVLREHSLSGLASGGQGSCPEAVTCGLRAKGRAGVNEAKKQREHARAIRKCMHMCVGACRHV